MIERVPFADRRDGGRVLATLLASYAGRDDVIVLGLPRGGVPVAFEVARALDAPLDVFLVRKLGVPGHEELAMGAIASGGVLVLNEDVLAAQAVGEAELTAAVRRERAELERREHDYRAGLPPAQVTGRTAIVVDDGLATGATMRAAVAALRDSGARRVVLAVPTAPASTLGSFEHAVDEIVCADTPDPFMAVGLWYGDFAPTSDEEVRELLAEGARTRVRQ
jgi:putative phosphoribosyl transferase